MRVYRLRLQKHFKFDQGELSVALWMGRPLWAIVILNSMEGGIRMVLFPLCRVIR
jgi:hypothetical protein